MAQSNAATAVQNLFRTPELKDKILFTLLCLLVYRIGAAVTAPGINPQAIADFINQQTNGGGLLGLYNLFTGGQLARATVFALGIMPYISASIFQQIAQAVVPQVDKMSKDEEGRKKINQWSRYATVVLAAVQAWGFAIFAESLPGAVANPGFALPDVDGVLPHDRRDLRHVAGRADHRARHRQRRELDDLLLDRRAHLAGHHASRSSSSARARSARSRCSC